MGIEKFTAGNEQIVMTIENHLQGKSLFFLLVFMGYVFHNYSMSYNANIFTAKRERDVINRVERIRDRTNLYGETSSAYPARKELRPIHSESQYNNQNNWKVCNQHFRDCLSDWKLKIPEAPLVVLLIGIPGSGKSTFGSKFRRSLPGKWDIFNQDILGSRKKVENAVTSSLQQGNSVIVDRCNFDATQRLVWLDLANKYGAGIAFGIVMPNGTNVEFCSKRAEKRGNDGIHTLDTDWNKVCRRMAKQYECPTFQEGFAAIMFCNSTSDLDILCSS